MGHITAYLQNYFITRINDSFNISPINQTNQN